MNCLIPTPSAAGILGPPPRRNSLGAPGGIGGPATGLTGLADGEMGRSANAHSGAAPRCEAPFQNLLNGVHWFAIQAQTGAEDVARCQIAALDLETLLPKVRRARVRTARPSPLKALFPGYLFARFSPELSLRAVRYARGVTRVLSAGATPIPVEASIIDEIRARMDPAGCVALDEPEWRPGDILEVKDGPFRGCQGIFERELDDHRRVVLLLEAIQHARVIIEKCRLETISRNR